MGKTTKRATESASSERVIYARVPAELHKRLRVVAAERGRPVSELVREAVRRYLEETGDNG